MELLITVEWFGKSILIDHLCNLLYWCNNNTKTFSGKGGLFAPDAAVDKSGKANRWSMFVPAFVTHVCLGAPYGWSAISGTLAREYGFVAASAGDWALSSATYPMSIMVSLC